MSSYSRTPKKNLETEIDKNIYAFSRYYSNFIGRGGALKMSRQDLYFNLLKVLLYTGEELRKNYINHRNSIELRKILSEYKKNHPKYKHTPTLSLFITVLNLITNNNNSGEGGTTIKGELDEVVFSNGEKEINDKFRLTSPPKHTPSLSSSIKTKKRTALPAIYAKGGSKKKTRRYRQRRH
jgi:hypothetical protein